MFKWLKDMFCTKESKGLLERLEEMDMIKVGYPDNVSEPVSTFVDYVKSNPKNFSVKMAYSSAEADLQTILRTSYPCYPTTHRIYDITDKKLGDHWCVSTSQRPWRYTLVHFDDQYDYAEKHYSEYITTVPGLPFELTCAEKEFLMSELSPLFERRKAKERLNRMEKSREARKRQLEVDRQQAERDKMLNKYKELL